MSKESPKKSSKTSAAGKAAPQARKKPEPEPKAKAGKTRAAAAAPAKRSLTASKPPAKPAKPSAGTTSTGESAAGAQVGDLAPDFQLPRDGGGAVALADYAGKQLVLFFYPRASTPGCTKEAIDFTRLEKAFAASGTIVLGVSADSVAAQDKFRDKYELNVPLVSDERHQILEAYGAWGEKSLYGRKFLGIIRSTVLIGRDGRIARIWRNVKVDGHADAVLAAASELHKQS